MQFSHFSTSLNIRSRYKPGVSIGKHSRTAITTSSLLRNRRHQNCCFRLHRTRIRKQNLLFVNGCEYNTQIYAASEFLNSSLEGTNTRIFLGITGKNNDTLEEYISYTERCNNLPFRFYDIRNFIYSKCLAGCLKQWTRQH
jgi:hypothetical protein